jgi:hypothetical protein
VRLSLASQFRLKHLVLNGNFALFKWLLLWLLLVAQLASKCLISEILNTLIKSTKIWLSTWPLINLRAWQLLSWSLWPDLLTLIQDMSPRYSTPWTCRSLFRPIFWLVTTTTSKLLLTSWELFQMMWDSRKLYSTCWWTSSQTNLPRQSHLEMVTMLWLAWCTGLLHWTHRKPFRSWSIRFTIRFATRHWTTFNHRRLFNSGLDSQDFWRMTRTLAWTSSITILTIKPSLNH